MISKEIIVVLILAFTLIACGPTRPRGNCAVTTGGPIPQSAELDCPVGFTLTRVSGGTAYCAELIVTCPIPAP